MLLFYSITKSLLWILIGLGFGAITLILLFVLKILYDKPVDSDILPTYGSYIMFLCVSIAAGASADWFNSPFRGWFLRTLPLFGCGFALGALCFIFHPLVKEVPDPLVITIMTKIYTVLAILVCVVLKSILFFEEGESYTKINLLNPIKF
jgi:hypothetical protein